MRILSPTILFALHGRFALHPWLDGSTVADAYGLLHTRSRLMGLTTSPVAPAAVALWEMNEAGQNWYASELGARVAWFQIGLPPGRDAVLPVFAAVAEGAAAVGRVGTLELGAVQVLVPLQVQSKAAHLAIGADWFVNEDPQARTQVRVEVDAGEPQALSGRDLRSVLDRLRLGYVRFHDADPLRTPLMLAPDGFGDDWMGPTRTPIAFDATISAWTVDAVGWLVTVVVECCRIAGVEGPVQVTVSRDAEPA
ncbi:MAG TPA: hypothetical protein DEQ61_07310 [Streptomyces sp.]|nr:hypothetical protein [Streptomyces sp.]